MVLWVFGYGSLIWKPCFSYEERVEGYVKNYRRVFHQGCIDFRGTVDSPGRTLTLEEQEGAITWGVAYRVTASVESRMVEAYLNQRERTYDVKAFLNFYTADCPHTPAVCNVMTYIATPNSSNEWYLGPAPLKKMAEQIAKGEGPAGKNYEYLFCLVRSLSQMGEKCVDQETFELAIEVHKILDEDIEDLGKLLKQALQSRPCDVIEDDSRKWRVRDRIEDCTQRRDWVGYLTGAGSFPLKVVAS